MGRIIVSSAVSVDGYSHGVGGDLGVMPLDHAFTRHNADLVAGAGRVLYGATFFRQALGFWPAAVDDADPDVRRTALRFAEGLPMTVVSDSLRPEDAGPWREQTGIVGREKVDAHVSGLASWPATGRSWPGSPRPTSSCWTWAASRRPPPSS